MLDQEPRRWSSRKRKWRSMDWQGPGRLSSRYSQRKFWSCRTTWSSWPQSKGFAKDDRRSVMIELITRYLFRCLCARLWTKSHVAFWCTRREFILDYLLFSYLFCSSLWWIGMFAKIEKMWPGADQIRGDWEHLHAHGGHGLDECPWPPKWTKSETKHVPNHLGFMVCLSN
jgi:hypothetical protein